MKRLVAVALCIALIPFGAAAAAQTEDAVLAAVKSMGFFMLDREEQRGFLRYVYLSSAFTPFIYTEVEEYINESGFFQKSPKEQSEILRSCLSLTGGRMADSEICPPRTKYSLTDGGEFDGFDVWMGKKADVYRFRAVYADSGAAIDIYCERGRNDAEKIAEAASMLPWAVRKEIKVVICFNDAAESYHGGSATVWIRRESLPSTEELMRSLAHETGHILDEKYTLDETVWADAIKADALPLSDYGNGGRGEDLAEFSRLYFTVRENSAAAEGVKTVYPNRTKAFEALLYACDSVEYASFAESWAELSPFEETAEICYYALFSPSGMAMTVKKSQTEGEYELAAEKYKARAAQLWELRRRKDGGVVIINKETGLALSGGGMAESPCALTEFTGKPDQTWDVEETEAGSCFRFRRGGMFLGETGSAPTFVREKTYWTAEIRQKM